MQPFFSGVVIGQVIDGDFCIALAVPACPMLSTPRPEAQATLDGAGDDAAKALAQAALSAAEFALAELTA